MTTTTDSTTPLSSSETQPTTSAKEKARIKMQQRTRSQDMVEDHHEHIVDEDPLLISQSLTYVTDDGSVLHSFQSASFSWGMFVNGVLVVFEVVLAQWKALVPSSHPMMMIFVPPFCTVWL
jgi:hypothetical protein